MKRLLQEVALLLACSMAAWSAAPTSLTTIAVLHTLTNAQASQAMPVAFEATVTYFRGYERLLFVQDGDVAIFVLPSTTDGKFLPGDRVLISGIMQPSFRPIVSANSITLLHHGTLPKPVPVGFDELIRAEHDSMRVTVHAEVRAVDMVLSTGNPVRSIRLQLNTDGGHMEANVDGDDASALEKLIDAEVELTGSAAGKFNDKMQKTGIVLYVSSLADVKVTKPASDSPWSLPVTPMEDVLTSYHVHDRTARVRVHGTITYFNPGTAVVLQDGSKSLWIATRTRDSLQIGDQADATGFPDAHDRFLTLTDGEVMDSHVPALITPLPATWKQLAFWNSSKPDGHQYDLVSIEGRVVAEVREAAQDEYVLTSDGQLFTAIYRHPRAADHLPPMMQIPLGSSIRVTGICTIADANPFNPGQDVPFDILLRSFDDITLIAAPSWLSIGNLMRVVGLLLLAVVAVAVWGWTLRRKVRSQTADISARIQSEAALERKMAQLETRRSRILEDINGVRPLAEILEEITDMVSFGLDGALCWCEVTNGARLGKRPPAIENLRVVREQIPARSGPPLGALFSGFDPATQPTALESEALSLGARLATLAIETRRLYADLYHRSEFDLLTDISNRFSLDKHLDALIEDARQRAGIFGLIYIDLDEFKAVNDTYGHRIGDLYLQTVALRMKRQLRSADVLARLGGDEFAALVTAARSRAEVEEVALRLERCMDEPFHIEQYVLRGSASVGIAVYPDDGASKDTLLSFADAAMYKKKHASR
ncbi:MAG: GGDEF domain-containing protein [Terracidiphilus sp.]|nr:GGDEF domain-containing protein [Terracidiphilus sp.]